MGDMLSKTKITVTLIVAAGLFGLASCKGKTKDSPPSTREIIKTYTKTLADAPKRARSAANAENLRNGSEQKALEDLDK